MYLGADILIIGGGCAACSAAIEAAKYDVKTLIVDKGIVGRSGSSATSGCWINATFNHKKVGSEEVQDADSREAYFQDTRTAGSFINDRRLVKIVVDEISEFVLESEKWGVNYNKHVDGRFVLHQSIPVSLDELVS